MKQFLQDYNMVFAMAAAGCLTIMMKSIASIVYYKLICQAEQMGSTQNKYMKALVGKITASYKLKREVHNIKCIVDKSMYNMRFLGVSAAGWKNAGIYGIATVFMLLISCLLLGVYFHMPYEWHALTGLSAIAVIMLLATSEILFQIHRKYRLLQLQMTDYLENILQPKLEKEYLHPEEEKKYQNEYFENEEQTDQQDEAAASMEDLKLFEEFVEEYLAD